MAVNDVPAQAIPSAAPQARCPSRGYWFGVLARAFSDRLTIVCGLVLLGIVAIAVLGPYVTPVDPYKTSSFARLRPIGTPGFPFGTDELGRDMLSRLMLGTRLSLLMGVTPVVAALFIGGLLGIVAGYAGGQVNTVVMRVIDVVFAFPSVLLAVAISGALGASVINTVVALTIVFVPPLARVAESVTTQVRNLDFVAAARASGAGNLFVIRRHVLANVLGPIFIYATSLVSVSIILASGLSFLGLGAKPPEPEWGLMLNTLRQAIYVQPWVAALPGVFIFVTSMCFNLMSDGLRTAMDVRS